MEASRLKARLAEAGLSAVSGMIAMEGEDYSSLESIRRTGGVAPDATWPANRAAALETARIARELGVRLVTFHAGFIPEGAASGGRDVVLERIRALRDLFAPAGIRVALETGQESAATLEGVIHELDDVGVNFDPANMILYGMGDPVAALESLLPRVAQVHIKDALPARAEGEWGAEVVAGTGAVDWPRFLEVLATHPVDLVVEREAGDDRVADVRAAVALVRGLGWPA
jgi:sugar phosphate isomerase/epimerase